MKKNIENKEKEIIKQQVEKHKKALNYIFFESTEPLEIKEIDILCHNRNGVRAVISFQEQKKVIYQEGSVALELGFKKYMTWFNHNVLAVKKLYYKMILSYAECGFLEHFSYKPCKNTEQKEDYYYHLGSVVALILSLNGEVLLESEITQVEDQPIVQDISLFLRNVPRYYKHLMDYDSLKKFITWQCPSCYEKNIRNGYMDVYRFMKENEKDIIGIADFCFPGGNIGGIYVTSTCM